MFAAILFVLFEQVLISHTVRYEVHWKKSKSAIHLVQA